MTTDVFIAGLLGLIVIAVLILALTEKSERDKDRR